MQEILIIYNSKTERYASYAKSEIESWADLLVTMVHIDNYQDSLSINNSPTFVLKKHGKVAYPLEGKHDLSTIKTWLINLGVKCS